MIKKIKKFLKKIINFLRKKEVGEEIYMPRIARNECFLNYVKYTSREIETRKIKDKFKEIYEAVEECNNYFDGDVPF